MHEGYIAQNIINIVVKELQDKNIHKNVKKVYLKVGKIHAIIPQSLQMFFNIIKKDNSSLQNAELVIEQIPIKVKCRGCNRDYELEEINFVCVFCGESTTIIQGQELAIVGIDLAE